MKDLPGSSRARQAYLSTMALRRRRNDSPAPVDEARRYFAFISYSHHDAAWADWLHKSLETYRTPRRLVGQVTAAGTIAPRLDPDIPRS